MDEREDGNSPQGEEKDTTVRIGLMSTEEMNQALLKQMAADQEAVTYLEGWRDALIWAFMMVCASFVMWDLGRRIC